MARLITTGYETGDINELGTSFIGSSATLTTVSTNPTPRLGGRYSLKCASTSTSNNNSYKIFTLGANKSDVWVRFGFWAHPLTETSEMIFAAVTDSAGAYATCLTFDGSDMLIRARQGGTVTGTLLGTSAVTMSIDAWHLLEWRNQITSTTVGTTEVWLDGTRIINFTGDNTHSAALANMLQVVIGHITIGAVNGYYHAFDDIAINDTNGSINNGQIYDGRVVLLLPNGAGSTTGQTRGGTDSGANWSQVDELPPSLTDYVYSATAGTRDTYTLENLPAGTWAVNCCQVLAYAQNNDAGAGSLGLTVKSGATTNEATAQALVVGAQYYRQLYETDPDTSAAWTTSAVNALEAGTTVR